MKGISAVKQRFKDTASGIKELPKDLLLLNFANQIKQRQIEWIKRGSPITEDEFRAGMEKEWRTTGKLYEANGISLVELIDLGLKSLNDTTGSYNLPRSVKIITKIAERNAQCPCGSGKKYKKCCGR